MTPLLTEAEREAVKDFEEEEIHSYYTAEYGKIIQQGKCLASLVTRLLSARAVPMELESYGFAWDGKLGYGVYPSLDGEYVLRSAAEAYTAGMRAENEALFSVLRKAVASYQIGRDISWRLKGFEGLCPDKEVAWVTEARALTDTTTKEEGGEDGRV